MRLATCTMYIHISSLFHPPTPTPDWFDLVWGTARERKRDAQKKIKIFHSVDVMVSERRRERATPSNECNWNWINDVTRSQWIWCVSDFLSLRTPDRGQSIITNTTPNQWPPNVPSGSTERKQYGTSSILRRKFRHQIIRLSYQTKMQKFYNRLTTDGQCLPCNCHGRRSSVVDVIERNTIILMRKILIIPMNGTTMLAALSAGIRNCENPQRNEVSEWEREKRIPSERKFQSNLSI